MRRALVGSLLVVLGFFASAIAVLAEDLTDIRSRGEVRVGVCLDSEPVGFRDLDGRPKGYDIDVVTQLAEQMQVRLELVEVSVPTRFEALRSGRVDVLACNVSATTDRALEFDFSFPYLRTGIKMLVLRGSGIADVDDLDRTHKVAVGRGTTADALLRRRAPQARQIFVSSSGEAALLLRQGQIDAYVQDSLIVDFIARGLPDRVEALPETYSFDAICFGIRKGNPELLRWLDLFASLYVSSGAYQKTYANWWGETPPELTPVW
ncbi:transporter substrate-binding domain-containing protein [Devosia sp.]|jgi:polar amino acid transport system substrate-binding protein|uniref:transporter substrate-binding domain-containing protein n=1 Tax=Devosia sp. TaxID=1871048 RepID=UPI0037BEADA6